MIELFPKSTFKSKNLYCIKHTHHHQWKHSYAERLTDFCILLQY